MRRRGSVLIQLLAGTAVTGLVMALLLQGTVSLWQMQSDGITLPGVQDDAREIALRVADALRGATLCTSTDSSCSIDAPVENATATGVTVYRRNDDGSLTEYAYGVTNGNFTMTVGSGSATSGGSQTTTFCTGATLTLTYYSASSYYSNGLTAYTPTNSTATTLAAVNIVSTVTRNGVTARFETFIRLRNSPKP